MAYKFHLNEPFLKGKEKEYLLDVMDSGWLSAKGKHTILLEQKFAEIIGTKYALAVQSGTAALHTALLALGVGNGDKVVIPNYTCGGCGTSVIQCGATPIILDVEPDTFALDANLLEELLREEKPKVVMVVHVYGFPARDIERIAQICRRNNIFLLEDCCEAHGAKLGTKTVGTFGDIAVFSIRSEKMIGVGEGGLILTDSKELMDRANYWASRAAPFRTSSDPWWKKYYYTDIGMNYLLPHLLGAVGHAQVENFPEIILRKRVVGKEYQRKLSGINGIRMQKLLENHNPSFWLNIVLLEEHDANSVRQIGEEILKNGIEIRPGFVPLGDLPPFKGMARGRQDVGRYIFEHGIVLPSSLYLADDVDNNIKEITQTLLHIMEEAKKTKENRFILR